MKNIWLTTDTHLGHTKLPTLDPRRPQDYEERIFAGMKAIQPGDTLIHLGDVTLGHRTLDEANHRAITSYAGANILVRGNHDRRTDTWYLDKGWDLVVEKLVIFRFGFSVALTHIPLDPAVWGSKFGKNVHGHTHGNGHRSVDVGGLIEKDWHVELALEHTNYRPVVFTEKLLRGRK
jgi:calcineurin-like phosphoesterase family protein